MRSVYLIGATGSLLVKIGSATEPYKRLASLQIGSPLPLSILWERELADAYKTEKALHYHFREEREHGEWFALGSDPLTPFKKAVSTHIDGRECKICTAFAREDDDAREIEKLLNREGSKLYRATHIKLG